MMTAKAYLMLKSVEKWCSEWQLSISVKKCAVMHIHSGNTRPVIGPSFDVGGYALPIVDRVKDLGVLVDDCLKFHHLRRPATLVKGRPLIMSGN